MYQISIKNMQLLILAGRFYQTDGWDHAGRKRTFNMIVHIEDGSCVFQVEDQKYTLFKDNIILIPKNTFYCPHTDTYCQYTYYHFLGDVTPVTNAPSHAITAPENNQQIYLAAITKAGGKTQAYLHQVLRELSNQDIGSAFRMNLAFLNALNQLSTACSTKANDGLAGELDQYIKNNIRLNLTLTDIAKQFNYTKQYIIQIFKNNYGTTPTKYINNKRLDLSLSYLTETNLKINEIAEKCGFSDANYFSRIFKARFNISPMEYRNQFNIK